MVAMTGPGQGDAEAPGKLSIFQPELGQMAGNIVRNPIRRVMMKVFAKKDRGEPCVMMAGGRPIATNFPKVCGAPVNEELMNYGPNLGKGSKELVQWCKDFILEQHAQPGGWERHDLIMTPGNTNSIAQVLMLCTDAGESVLCDEFTYTGIMAAARPLGRKTVAIPMDSQGMIPSELKKAADALGKEEGGRAPRLLYMVPTGHNPTARTVPGHRRRELYKVAEECNLLILEDDPYCNLLLGADSAKSMEDMPGLAKDPHGSFLSIDSSCRVIHLESCSKVLAPGFRMGWLTGPKAIVDKLSVMSEVLTWSLSGFTQQAFFECVTEMGRTGLHKHLQKVQWAYRTRRDIVVKAFDKHLTGLAEWVVPTDGMFLWLTLKGVHDTAVLAEALVDRGVAMVNGSAFASEEGRPCPSFRVSFSHLTEEGAEKAAKCLAESLRDDSFLEAHGVKRGHTTNGIESTQEPASKVQKVS